MSKHSLRRDRAQRRRSRAALTLAQRAQEPAPVTVTFKCPVCNGPHRRDQHHDQPPPAA